MSTNGAPPAMIDVELMVNGRPEHIMAKPHHTLVEVLRDQLGLQGTREGCGIGMCGACTVLLDGRPVSGCLVLAPMAEGHEIVTIEGLGSPDGGLGPVQEAFIEHTAFQCSFCTPGFILSAHALLGERPNVSDDEAVEELTGNLCRCGSYSRIRMALATAREQLAGRDE